MWYRLTPPASGVLIISSYGSDFDTVLALYSGASLASLSEEACNDDEDIGVGLVTSRLEAAVHAGQTYYLQIGGFDGAGGLFRVSASLDTTRSSPSTATPTRAPTQTPTVRPTQTPGLLPAGTPLPPVAAFGDAFQGAPSTQSAAGAAAPQTARSPGGVRGGYAPVVTTSSLFSASTVTFTLPGGRAISVTLDEETINAVRLALPRAGSLRSTFDPAPSPLDEAQRGSLGGGIIVPVGDPVELKLELRDSAGNVVKPQGAGEPLPSIRLTLPVLPHPVLPGGTFAWLHAVYENGVFLGYVRPAATFDPPTSTLDVRLPVDVLSGTLFLPVVIVPAWVQNFDAGVHIHSGPTPDAVDYGVAAPRFTKFTVVAPQVGSRLFVYNPETQNYGWIDVAGVGPSGPPG